ncbi:hypothetical protein [Mycobacterium sp. 1274756.6]|uniref:hypothetical protein n=1 Tax=Mycobacterium sp. 1274756.6 TaxID=1834076 RepID=UPI0007FCF7A9|nr:hypothetical protein [Mycobacterium sp. 1274756.6]OBJ70987.1 hypothetical protein A5643_08835 [Mycobacterium sp. 1274756.6]
MTHSADPNAAQIGVLLLGDTDTLAHRDDLVAAAQSQNCVLVDAYGFEQGEPDRTDDLAEVEAVVAALSRAITDRLDVWVPFLGPDLGREQHWRRLSIVLQRHGLNLRATRNLWPFPTDGGIHELDFALRREVRAVDALDNAALAAAGMKKLSRDIERTLVAAASARSVKRGLRPTGEPRTVRPAERSGTPVLPPAEAPWDYRKPLLRRYARWLVDGCGVTQAATARVLNSAGQRTATGRQWRPGTVGALLQG